VGTSIISWVARSKHKLLQRLRLLSEFALAQGTVQFLNLLVGFWLVRWLSVDSYARYGLALSIQSMMSVFLDMGFGAAIVALVGSRVQDSTIIGNYVGAARYFRARLLLIVGLFGSIVFWTATSGRGWDTIGRLILLMSIISSVAFQGLSAIYTGPLLIQRRFKEVYIAQLSAGFFRLGLVVLLRAVGHLSAEIAAVVNSAGLAISCVYYKSARATFNATGSLEHQRTARREVAKHIAPTIPGIVFFAVQGQLTLLLITYLGNHTEYIAEVSALGRLGQLFLLLLLFQSNLVAPYVARIPDSKVIITYLQWLGFASIFSILLLVVAERSPHLFLFLVGEKYSHLTKELPWSIGTGCISYLGGVLWSMNNARQFVYWWASWMQIFLVVVGQLLAISFTDVTSTLGAIKLSLVSVFLTFFVYSLTAAYGLRSHRRRMAVEAV